MLWFIVTAALGAALTLVLHEGSHALVVARAPGASLTRFRPWPGWYRGHWYNGLVLYTGELGELEAVFYGAPLIKASALFVLWGLAGIGWHPLWCLAAWELVDLAWWLRGYLWRRPRSDGGKLRIVVCDMAAAYERLLAAYDTLAWMYVADHNEAPSAMDCICVRTGNDPNEDVCPRCRLERAGVLDRVRWP